LCGCLQQLPCESHTLYPVFVVFIAFACWFALFLFACISKTDPQSTERAAPFAHLQVNRQSEKLEPEASASLLKSSPNILENFAYDEFQPIQTNHPLLKRMATTPVAQSGSQSSSSSTSSSRKAEPKFCDTLERHAFMRNVINQQPESTRRYSTPGEKEAQVRRSLEEITKDLKEIEQFVSATEELMQREKEQEQMMYSNKENKCPSPVKRVTYKINAYKAPPRRHRPGSPRFYHSRLYFRNGKIGCVDSTEHQNNVGATHALVKHILHHEKPLVSPDSVRRVLEQDSFEMVPLPGAVPEIVPDPIAIQRAEELAAATGQVVLSKEEEEEEKSSPLHQVESQPDVDEDEQDVQICYNESPELQNEDRNERTQRTPSINESEIVAVDEPDTEMNSDVDHRKPSSAGSLDSQGQQFLRDQVRHLVRRFTARANKVKSRIELPPTPSSSSTVSSPSPPPTKSLHPSPQHKVRLVPAGQSPHRGRLFEADTPRSNVWLCSSLCGANNDERTLDPQGKIYISWLCVVSLSFLYNAWVIPLRASFPFQTKENTNIWLACDFCADIIYLLDVVFFKHRVMYLFEGFWVKNKNLTRKNYMRKLQFKVS